jgi:hypothetical protein
MYQEITRLMDHCSSEQLKFLAEVQDGIADFLDEKAGQIAMVKLARRRLLNKKRGYKK